MSLHWSDERYVRLYTRDTPSWLLGPWEARAVLAPVLRKLDRAGTLDLGAEGLEALAVVVAMPLDVVEAGMAWWLRRGTFELRGGVLVAPNFLEAQESASSDAKRSREKRERARDLARARDLVDDTKRDGRDTTPVEGPSSSSPSLSRVEVPTATNRGGGDTNRDGSSRNVSVVTRGDTPSRAVPSQAVPSQPDTETSAAPPAGSAEPSPSAEVREVFDHWARARAKLTGAKVESLKLTADRRRKIAARLREGYSVANLRQAVDGMMATDFNVEKGFTDVELACRDASHVDRFMASAKPSKDPKQRGEALDDYRPPPDALPPEETARRARELLDGLARTNGIEAVLEAKGAIHGS